MNLLSTNLYPNITLKPQEMIKSVEEKYKVNNDENNKNQSFSQYLQSNQEKPKKRDEKKENTKEINDSNSELILYDKTGKEKVSQVRPSFDIKY